MAIGTNRAYNPIAEARQVGEGEGGKEVVEVAYFSFFAMAGLALGVEHGAELNMTMKLQWNFPTTSPILLRRN